MTTTTLTGLWLPAAGATRRSLSLFRTFHPAADPSLNAMLCDGDIVRSNNRNELEVIASSVQQAPARAQDPSLALMGAPLPKENAHPDTAGSGHADTELCLNAVESLVA